MSVQVWDCWEVCLDLGLLEVVWICDTAPFGPRSQGFFLEQTRKTVEKCLVLLYEKNSVSPVCLITVNLAVGLCNCFSVSIAR